MRLPTLIPFLISSLPFLASAAEESSSTSTTTSVAPIPSGLTIEHLNVPECTRKTKLGDTISVHYRGSLAADGTQFDASYDRGQPLKFEVGKGRVIKG
jgi:FK506-binding protein 2